MPHRYWNTPLREAAVPSFLCSDLQVLQSGPFFRHFNDWEKSFQQKVSLINENSDLSFLAQLLPLWMPRKQHGTLLIHPNLYLYPKLLGKMDGLAIGSLKVWGVSWRCSLRNVQGMLKKQSSYLCLQDTQTPMELSKIHKDISNGTGHLK